MYVHNVDVGYCMILKSAEKKLTKDNIYTYEALPILNSLPDTVYAISLNF